MDELNTYILITPNSEGYEVVAKKSGTKPIRIQATYLQDVIDLLQNIQDIMDEQEASNG